ncbi:hypothetical protein [Nitrobacter sp. JJSN]|uniref:hypothetical protein n=1 Tax=Nitrobacter sp. JJSN TaxID=3453033 RepID=UPI003F76B51D
MFKEFCQEFTSKTRVPRSSGLCHVDLEGETLTIVLRGDLVAIQQFVAAKKNPTSFRKPGFWMTCYRKHRWLRG